MRYGKQLISIAFILMIVSGNIWLVYLLGAQAIPRWLIWLVQLSVILLLLGAITYIIGRLMTFFSRH